MEVWKEYKLNDVATLSTGFPFDGHKYAKEGIRVVRGDNVTIGSLRWDTDKDKRWNEPFNRASEYSLRADDIVIGMDGSRVGKNRAQIKQEDLPLYIAQRVACIRHNDLSLQSFLYYQIFSQDFENYIKAVQTGTSIPHVSLKQIGDFPIMLPSLKVQQKIADILKTLDKKIEVNRKLNDNLPYLIQLMALIILLLLKRINDNFEQQALALFDKMFPQITKGDSTVGNMITPQRGKGLLSKNAIPGEVPVVAGGIEPATFHNVSNTTPPVLTIAASGANAGYINLWHIPVWSSDSSFIDSKMTSNVYFWYVMLKKRQKEIFDAQVGSAQPHIYPKHIAELPMQDVEENRLLDYNRIVTPVFKQIGKNVAENNRLASIRDVLLPKLMSGELKIS